MALAQRTTMNMRLADLIHDWFVELRFKSKIQILAVQHRVMNNSCWEQIYIRWIVLKDAHNIDSRKIKPKAYNTQNSA